jgi:hypothetical protein
VQLLVEAWPESILASNTSGVTPTDYAELPEVLSWLYQAAAVLASRN